MSDNTTEWMSPAQLAEWLGVPVATVYKWRHEGHGPPGFKVGRHVRFHRPLVDEWLGGCADGPKDAA